MTWLEMYQLIGERAEKVLSNETRFVITDKHRYIRVPESLVSNWREDTEPGAPERKLGRGGEYYVWRREEELPDLVIT